MEVGLGLFAHRISPFWINLAWFASLLVKGLELFPSFDEDLLLPPCVLHLFLPYGHGKHDRLAPLLSHASYLPSLSRTYVYSTLAPDVRDYYLRTCSMVSSLAGKLLFFSCANSTCCSSSLGWPRNGSGRGSRQCHHRGTRGAGQSNWLRLHADSRLGV